MAVWLLETDNDFTAFIFPLEDDKAFFQDLAKSHFEESKTALHLWRPLYMLRSEPMKHPDFFEIDGTDVIAISQKSADSIHAFSNHSVELLPIETDAGRYYALNILGFLDCLNKEESVFVAAKNGAIVSYSLLEFNEEALGHNVIFKIPELPYFTFISDDFVEQYEDNHLKGLLIDPQSNLVWCPEEQ